MPKAASSLARATDVADVDELKEVGLAAVAHTLLERTDALNEVSHHGEVFFCKHVIREQDLLRTSQKPAHQVNSVMDIPGKNIEFLLQLPQSGFFGPFFDHPCRFDIAQHRFCVAGFNEKFILRGIRLQPRWRIDLKIC